MVYDPPQIPLVVFCLDSLLRPSIEKWPLYWFLIAFSSASSSRDAADKSRAITNLTFSRHWIEYQQLRASLSDLILIGLLVVVHIATRRRSTYVEFLNLIRKMSSSLEMNLENSSRSFRVLFCVYLV